MEVSGTFKRAFLGNLLAGLQRSPLPSEPSERKNRIMLLSNVALASTRQGAKWSKALISRFLKDEAHEDILTSTSVKEMKRASKSCEKFLHGRKVRALAVRKRSYMTRRMMRSSSKKRPPPAWLASRMINSRAGTLRSLVPGGQRMDEVSLLEETLDYIVFLRAQVDVMQGLASVFDTSK